MLQRFSDLPITCELMKPHRFDAVNVDEHVSEFFLNSDCSSTESLSCCCCCSVCCFSCLLQIRWLIKKPKPKPTHTMKTSNRIPKNTKIKLNLPHLLLYLANRNEQEINTLFIFGYLTLYTVNIWSGVRNRPRGSAQHK